MLSMNAMDLYGNVGFVLISWWGGWGGVVGIIWFLLA